MSSDTRSVDQMVQPFIGDALSTSESEATVEVINPSNGRGLLSIPAGTEGGLAGMESYLRRQLVWINHG